MLQHGGRLWESPRACVYHLAAEWQLKSSRRMAVKHTSNNSLLVQRDSGLWLPMLIQKQSIQCLGRREPPLCGAVDIAWKTKDGVSHVLGFSLKMSNDLPPCPFSSYQPWTPQRTRAQNYSPVIVSFSWETWLFHQPNSIWTSHMT